MFRVNSSYIGVYDNVITKKDCNRIIELFEESSKINGLVYNDGLGEENSSVKKSIELENCSFNTGTEISMIILDGLSKAKKKYHEKYFLSLESICPWNLDSGYNIQKYETEEDGYKSWHTEHGPGTGAYRILVWTIYLNDAKSGTEFINYSKVRAKAGRCVIWPAAWTHAHKSEKNRGLKYIATGWISYT